MKIVILALTGLALIASAVGGRNLADEVLLRAMNRKAHSQNGERILGGDDAVLGQFPWQASMDDNWYGHLCGGSIISETFIVTAAHCADAVNMDANAFQMRVGLVDLAGNSVDVKVKKVYQHGDWDSFNLINDIALIELATPLTFNDNVKPITLGVGQTPSQIPGDCVASGWGATDGQGWFYPDDLQFLDMDFYEDSRCSAQWTPVGVQYDNRSHMCAGTDSGDSVCFGDSGGPLVCKSAENGQQYLYGATSFGNSPCGQVAYPAVWTDLVNFIDYIESVTGPLPRPI